MTVKHLSDLHQDPKNARAHNPRNVGMIADALREVGAARSGVIDEDGRILAGNATWEALAEAGIERVRVVKADGNEWVVVQREGLTEEQKRRLALYDNRAAELADWDPEILAELAQDDGLLEGLWSEGELEDLLSGIAVHRNTSIIRWCAGYDAHQTEPCKFAFRMEAAWRARGVLALDLFSGKGALAQFYRRRFDRVVTVDKNPECSVDYVMEAQAFIDQHLDGLLSFDFVDFDDEGTPAREIAAFFEAIAGRKEESFVLALTDGYGLHLKIRGSYNPGVYLQGEDRPRRATHRDYEHFEDTVTEFVRRCTTQWGFRATNWSCYRGRMGNVVYQTWLIEPL